MILIQKIMKFLALRVSPDTLVLVVVIALIVKRKFLPNPNQSGVIKEH
jgi:hypothetical protein